MTRDTEVIKKFVSFPFTRFYYTTLKPASISLIAELWNSLKEYGSTLKVKKSTSERDHHDS